MRTIMTLGMLLLGTASFAQNNYGDITGTLVDVNSEGISDAIAMTYYGETMYRTKTDPDGRFRITGIPAGSYTVSFIYEGDTINSPRTAEVAPDGYGDVGIVKFESATDLTSVDITVKLVLEKGEAPVTKMTAKEIKFSSAKNNMKGLITGMTSEVRQTDDGSLVFRGARKGDLIYYVDGVKLTQVYNLPSSSLGYVMVYSGAIPAKYGDTNGGVIVVETRSYFDLLREYNSRMSLGGN